MRRRLEIDGVELSWVERGAGAPLLLLHGFSGSATGMAPLAETLSQDFRVLAVDLLGHGESEAPDDPAPYRMERCTAQLAGLLDRSGARPAHVFGYSMGGRVALGLGVLRPDCVRSLALLGASAGLSDPEARAERSRHDADLADAIERDGVEAFARRWSELPLFETQKRTLSDTARAELHGQRLQNRAQGLANSLRGLGSGVQPPLRERVSALSVPVWLGYGAKDAKFGAIAAELAALLPGAETGSIPAAGHAAHLENPDALLAALRRFLARAEHPHRPADALRAAPGG